MNVNKSYTLISGFVFLIVLTFSNYSCLDKCKDKLCENGYCIKGDCFCDAGYSGENCEIRESDKFAGKYSGKIICDNLEQSVTTIIENYFENPWDISVNIDNYTTKMDLRAHVKSDSIFIENQFVELIDSYTVNGTVVYDTVVNLIYPSSGILKNDSILEFDLKMKGEEILSCFTKLAKE